jgi:general secretion pathway protein C
MSSIKNILIFLLGTASAFFILCIIKFLLPNIPVTYTTFQSKENFFNINLQRIFTSNKNGYPKTNNTHSSKINATLKGIILKATYNDGKRAFIIIQEKKNSYFIDLNKTFKGYKLIKINPDTAIFTKNSKNYIIKFGKDNKKSNYKKINNTSDTIFIKKSTVLDYKKNIAKIWNNIGIVKYKRGYKITYIKPGSIFDKIGLKKGDIILQVNGKELSNDKEAWQLYKNIDKFDALDIEIERNHTLKVIHYEMD